MDAQVLLCAPFSPIAKHGALDGNALSPDDRCADQALARKRQRHADRALLYGPSKSVKLLGYLPEYVTACTDAREAPQRQPFAIREAVSSPAISTPLMTNGAASAGF